MTVWLLGEVAGQKGSASREFVGRGFVSQEVYLAALRFEAAYSFELEACFVVALVGEEGRAVDGVVDHAELLVEFAPRAHAARWNAMGGDDEQKGSASREFVGRGFVSQEVYLAALRFEAAYSFELEACLVVALVGEEGHAVDGVVDHAELLVEFASRAHAARWMRMRQRQAAHRNAMGGDDEQKGSASREFVGRGFVSQEVYLAALRFEAAYSFELEACLVVALVGEQGRAVDGVVDHAELLVEFAPRAHAARWMRMRQRQAAHRNAMGECGQRVQYQSSAMRRFPEHEESVAALSPADGLLGGGDVLREPHHGEWQFVFLACGFEGLPKQHEHR